MSTAEFYNNFWTAYDTTKLGPREFSRGRASGKNGNLGYSSFASRFRFGFFPVATIRLNGRNPGAIGVELFSTSIKARRFLDEQYDALDEVALGNITATKHINRTDCKIELMWHDANISDTAHQSAHFLWINLGIHCLAKSYLQPIEAFSEHHYS